MTDVLFQWALCLAPSNDFHEKEWVPQTGMHTYIGSATIHNLRNQLIVLLVNKEWLDNLYLTNVVNFMESRLLRKKALRNLWREKQFNGRHCVKSVQIRSFFWSVFSCIRTEYGYLRGKSWYSIQIQENTDQKKLRIWILLTQCPIF